MTKETLRERNKSDKLRRIREAARDLFSSQDFDATSTREIAARANVGLATLFLYASDKRDLLFLACNDDLEALTERAFAAVDTDLPMIDQLTTFFGYFFAFYGRDRLLSKALLRELTFYTTGQQCGRFQATRRTTIDRVSSLVGTARQRNALVCASADAEIAHVIFYVFAAEIRRWLGAETASPEDGLRQLAKLFEVVIAGLERL